MTAELKAATDALKERRSAPNHHAMAEILKRQAEAFDKPLDDALYHADRSVAADPRFVPARRLRAAMMATLGRLTAALADWAKVDELGALTRNDRLARVEVYGLSGMVDEAARDLGQILAENPVDFEALGKLQDLRRG